MGELKNKAADHPVEGSVYGAGAFVILANMVGWGLTPEQSAAILFAVPVVVANLKRAWPYFLKAVRQFRDAWR